MGLSENGCLPEQHPLANTGVMASCHTGRPVNAPSADLLRALALRFLVVGLVLSITGATLLGLIALLSGAGLLLPAGVNPRGAGAGREQPG